MNEELEKYQEMAKSYLAKKERINYYETEGFDDTHCESAYMLTELTDDEVRQIRALKERYGKEDFVKHLNEVFDDEDVIYDLFYGDPVDIDLDHIYHKYRFSVHEVCGEDKIKTQKLLIQMSDEVYSKLLAWYLFDEHLVINTLLYHDEELFKLISRKVIHLLSDEGCFMSDTPYTITMDEAKEDSKLIAEEQGIPRVKGYRWLGI